MFTKTAQLHNVPYEDLLYVERKDKNSRELFQLIRDKLNENPVVVITQDKTITVPTGKSTLAAQYVRKKVYTAYTHIIWLDTADLQTYQKSLKNIDLSSGEELIKKYILNGECLVIIDNAVNSELVENLISLTKNGKDNEVVLITNNDSLYPEKNKIYVDKFSLENSINLGIVILKKFYRYEEKNYFHLLMEFINYDVYKLRKILLECVKAGISLKTFFTEELKSGIFRLSKLLQARRGINSMDSLTGKDYANFSEEFWKNDEAISFQVAVDVIKYVDSRKLTYSYICSHFDNLIHEMLAEFTDKLTLQ